MISTLVNVWSFVDFSFIKLALHNGISQKRISPCISYLHMMALNLVNSNNKIYCPTVALGYNHTGSSTKRELRKPKHFIHDDRNGSIDLYQLHHTRSNDTQSLRPFIFMHDMFEFLHFLFSVTSFAISALYYLVPLLK